MLFRVDHDVNILWRPRKSAKKATNEGRFKKIKSWQIHRWPVAWHVKEPCGSTAHHHVNRAANIPWTLNHQPVKLRTSPSWTKMKNEPLTTNLSLWPTFAAQKLHPFWSGEKAPQIIFAPYLFKFYLCNMVVWATKFCIQICEIWSETFLRKRHAFCLPEFGNAWIHLTDLGQNFVQYNQSQIWKDVSLADTLLWRIKSFCMFSPNFMGDFQND